MILLAILLAGVFAAEPPKEAKRWWSHIQVMASDVNEGRDTGSEGYKRAAQYVTKQFQRLGLRPAGENGYAQPVPLHSVELKDTSIEIVRNGNAKPLRFLEEISITAKAGLPESIEAAVIAADDEKTEVKGKFAIVHSAARAKALEAAGAAGIIVVDNMRVTEPPRWPVAYAKAVSINPPIPTRFFTIRASEKTGEELLREPGHTALRIKTRIELKNIESDNLIGMLPGELPEYVVVSAHLDGYGIGFPVNGDKIYNGAFDDCAYVSTLLELAAHRKESGQKWKRGILFLVVTGEEKGLLGSAYFTAHATIPKEQMVADINLDYLRPIFPLRMLTALAIDQSTLGDMARKVAEPMGIRIQPDLEPERGLYRRSDQFNFIRIGVPGIAFIFGYEKGSPEEATYRKWYMERYHKPADDLNQPIDFAAAMKFNQFFEKLVEAVAMAPERPKMLIRNP